MKIYGIFNTVALLVIIIITSSCSGGNGGYSPGAGTDPVGALTSQVKLAVARVEQGEFLNDLGYTIAVSQVMVTMADVEICMGDGHTHSSRHEETGPESTVGSTLKGEWTVFPYAGDTLLGVCQANPGSYDTLSFSIVPDGQAHGASSASGETRQDRSPSVIMEGTAAKDGAAIPFKAHLPIDGRATVSGLALEFQYGHYLPVHLVFPVKHWVDGVDFNTLAADGGTIYINGIENPAAADIMTTTILHHVHVHTGEVAGHRGPLLRCRGPACMRADMACHRCGLSSKLHTVFHSPVH